VAARGVATGAKVDVRRGEVARVDFGGCVLWGDDGFLLRATVRGRLMGPQK